ncbi:MAG TPA: ribonuclease HII [Acidobacteriota bacterium]|nr:ribonuclease HII [Acidobacteriota bacterium]
MTPDLSTLSVAQIRKRFMKRRPTPKVLRLLESDGRSGVRQVYEFLQRKADEEKRERRRISRMLRFERGLWKSGLLHVAGVDEAGIGPLAGPVVAAAVIFPARCRILGIDDSKKLNPELRQEMVEQIRKKAIAIGIGVASVEEIDGINIYHAGLLAMKRAVENLPTPPEYLLIDARTIPAIAVPQDGVKRGDALCFSIAAASIVAKTYRDRLMESLDSRYPEYGFARHKGYSTPEHQRALRQFGPSPIHRRSFLYLEEVCGRCSPLFYSYLAELDRANSVEELQQLKEQWQLASQEFSDYEQRKFHQRLMRRLKRHEEARANSRNICD